MNTSTLQKVSAASLLVALGIIYGDIGTSPLYVMKAIVGDRPISQLLVYGGISCIFWTLTFQTTFKYIFQHYVCTLSFKIMLLEGQFFRRTTRLLDCKNFLIFPVNVNWLPSLRVMYNWDSGSNDFGLKLWIWIQPSKCGFLGSRLPSRSQQALSRR